ncbi:uncharacterized protein LOC129757975 [Uranotaenia lowii]|uniref:uncharacterized protein LOC129757975 n=1 Tax=Uranotaenia lowii TaxID=190385 RepID=UPI002479EDD0|nr:uncharacterized protein LOC129757975 [Uranotaenia lowii]
MGIFHSKVAPKESAKESATVDFPDPRSPTVNINRSPIGVENALEKPIITKVRDLTSDLTEILDQAQTPERVQQTIAAAKLQSVFDPRSPGSFVRTPMVLDETDASNISLRGTSLEYEEISGTEDQSSELGERSLSFQDCEDAIHSETVIIQTHEADSLFSDGSFNTELKGEIDNIIQNLFDGSSGLAAGNKDPRSPSVNIQRTPIVFEDKPNKKEDEEEHKSTEEQSQPREIAGLIINYQKNDDNPLKASTPISSTVIHMDENPASIANTPKRERATKGDHQLKSLSRTPLGCVTNIKTPGSTNMTGQHNMRKTALLTQMKQNALTVPIAADSLGSAEVIAKGRKSASGPVRSKIPIKSK